jgi:hypothetical protein
VSDLDDDFQAIPKRGGQTLIFMIGCGHMENGAWQFKCFTADSMNEPSEGAVIDAWLSHMDATKQRLAVTRCSNFLPERWCWNAPISWVFIEIAGDGIEKLKRQHVY